MWKAGRTETAARSAEMGFTYPAALILIVAVALAAQATSIPTSGQLRSEREAELLFRGQAYIAAIESYASAEGTGELPGRLQDLLADPRQEGRRHIRRLYEDPMPDGGWRVIQDAGGGIQGVVSTAPGKPRRLAHFPKGLEDFEDAETYQDWRFVFEQ